MIAQVKEYAIVGGLGVVMLAVSYFLGSPHISESDEAYYAVVARNVVEYGSLNTTIYLPEEIIGTGFPGRDTHMAGYMILLALPVALFGPNDQAFLLLSQIGYIACGLLVFWAGKQVFSRSIGYVSAAVFYVYPLFFFYANTAMTEITLQVVASLFFCVWITALRQPRLAHSLLFSLLLTIGTAIRPTFLLFLPTVPYALLHSPVAWRRRAWIWFGISLVVLMATVVYPLSLERAEGSYKFYQILKLGEPRAIAQGFIDNFVLQASRHLKLPQRFPEDYIRLLQILIFALGIVAFVRLKNKRQRETIGFFLATAIITWIFLALFYTPSGARGLRNLMVVLPPGLIGLTGLLFSVARFRLRYILLTTLMGVLLFFSLIGMQGPLQERHKFYAKESRKAEIFAKVLDPYHPKVVLAYKPFLYAVNSFPVNVIRRFPSSLEMMQQLQEQVTIDAIVVDNLAERDRFLRASREGLIKGQYRAVNQSPIEGYYFLVRGELFRRPVQALLGEGLLLLGVDTDGRAIRGTTLPLTLVWKANQRIQRDYAMAIRLVDLNGREAQYWLGRPVQSTRPTNTWLQDEIVVDTWDLNIASDLPVGQYILEVEIYDTATLKSEGKVQVGTLSL
jgi:hypothetical protein